MSNESVLTHKRASILHRYFSYACDKNHPFQMDDLQEMCQRFSVNAQVMKVPDSHKWLLKITKVFENMAAIATPSERITAYNTVQAIYNDNEETFRFIDPDSCQLGLQKIQVRQPDSSPH